MKRSSLFSVLMLSVLTAVICSCTNNEVRRDFHEWYFPNGMCTHENTTPDSRIYDVTGFTQEWIHISNVGMHDANVKLTFFTENKPPRDTAYIVPFGQNKGLYMREGRLGNLVDINSLYGLRVVSDEEIMIQITRVESSEDKKDFPRLHMESDIGYPGPLGQREKTWMYVDCWSHTSDTVWLEKEWLNILNPSDAEADVTITFRNRFTGEKTHYSRKIGAERISTFDLTSFPVDIYKEQVGYSVFIESDVPVVAMQLRRLFYKKEQTPLALVSNIAFPVGDRKNLNK